MLVQGCLVMEPAGRLTCEELLEHSYFDGFRDWFKPELEVGVTAFCTPTIIATCTCIVVVMYRTSFKCAASGVGRISEVIGQYDIIIAS